MCICALVLYVLWQAYSVRVCSCFLPLSLMCFPCVLERQTQLHFNDTQMLLGFGVHVYTCTCRCLCKGVRLLLEHFTEKPVRAPPALYALRRNPCWNSMPHLVNARACMCTFLRESPDSEQLYLPWKGDICTHLLFKKVQPLLQTNTHIHTQQTWMYTHRLQGVPGQDETGCELQMTPKTELLLSDKWDKYTLALSLSLSFFPALPH